MGIQFNSSNAFFENEGLKKVWKNAFVLNGVSYDLIVEVDQEDLRDVFLPQDTIEKVVEAWRGVSNHFCALSQDQIKISHVGSTFYVGQTSISDENIQTLFRLAFSCFEVIQII